MDVGAELDERLEAPGVLGELVVDGRKDALLHIDQRDGELPLFAAEVRARVALPEGGFHLERVACGLADEPAVDLGERLARADLNLHALGVALFDFLAVDRQREVDGDDVPLLRGAGRLGGLERRVTETHGLESRRPPSRR